MQQSHGMGYAEYERSFDKRIEVEKIREAQYRESVIFTASLNK